jgi:subtilisin family serine protease
MGAFRRFGKVCTRAAAGSVVVLLVGAMLVPNQWAYAAPPTTPGAPNHANDRASFIVRTTSTQTSWDTAVAANHAGAHIQRAFSNAIFGFSADMTRSTAAAIAREPGVISVEPNAVFTPTTVEANATWGLDRIDQTALPLDHSYTYGQQGAGVTAYVVDTGIDAAHSEFTGRLNPGWSAFPDEPGTDDCIGHGTHVAGTIGGTTFGVAKSVRITPVRVFSCLEPTYADTIIAALDWVVADHQAGQPAVLNMSLGGPLTSALNAATTRVVDDGIFVAVAAGNSDWDACQFSPASALGAVSVGATDRNDVRADFSNYGACVDVFAPGVDVTSAATSGGFVTYSGTSMASPHVAGVAARLLSAHPAASPRAIAGALLDSATPGVVTDPGPKSPNKLLYADPADGTPLPPADVSPPSTPANVSAEAWDYHTTHLLWDASTDDQAVAGYEVFRDGSPAPVGSVRTPEFVDTDPDLMPNTTYSYTVKAVDRSGNLSAASATVNATTSTFSPLAPVVLEEDVTAASVHLLLGDPNDIGVAQTVEVWRNGALVQVIPPFLVAQGLFDFFDSSLNPNTTYTYQLRTTDRWGDVGAFSNVPVRTAPDLTPPTPPLGLKATALSSSSIRVSWGGSFDDGRIASYRVYRGTTLIATRPGSARSFDDTGLQTDTEYSYSVRAVDGAGHVSNPSTTRGRTAPANDGYWMLGRDGAVYNFRLGNYGSDNTVLAGQQPPAASIAGAAGGRGYWVLDQSGRVFGHGSAHALGNAVMGAGERAVAIVGTASGNGYWIASSRGRVLAFGDAAQLGPPGAISTRAPIIGMARNRLGTGYVLLGADGGIFAFGDMRYRGSTGGRHLNSPIVGIAATPTGEGYWLVAGDGGIFAFGDATFYGSTGSLRLASPMTGMQVAPGGHGYRLVAADGGVFSFGNAPFLGSLGGRALAAPIVGVAGR